MQNHVYLAKSNLILRYLVLRPKAIKSGNNIKTLLRGPGEHAPRPTAGVARRPTVTVCTLPLDQPPVAGVGDFEVTISGGFWVVAGADRPGYALLWCVFDEIRKSETRFS